MELGSARSDEEEKTPTPLSDADAENDTYRCTVPQGVQPGQTFKIGTESGFVDVVVPAGVAPGQARHEIGAIQRNLAQSAQVGAIRARC